MVREHPRLDGHESEQTPGDSNRQGNLACCSPWSRKESDTNQKMSNSLQSTLLHLKQQSCHLGLLKPEIWSCSSVFSSTCHSQSVSQLCPSIQPSICTVNLSYLLLQASIRSVLDHRLSFLCRSILVCHQSTLHSSRLIFFKTQIVSYHPLLKLSGGLSLCLE